MQFNPHLAISRFIGRRDGRRIPGRVRQESLTCDLGSVLDLSVGGMRLLSTCPRVGDHVVSLRGMDVDLRVRARVAWSRRLGFRRHEIGMAFEDVDKDVAEILTRIATVHRSRHAI